MHPRLLLLTVFLAGCSASRANLPAGGGPDPLVVTVGVPEAVVAQKLKALWPRLIQCLRLYEPYDAEGRMSFAPLPDVADADGLFTLQFEVGPSGRATKGALESRFLDDDCVLTELKGENFGEPAVRDGAGGFARGHVSVRTTFRSTAEERVRVAQRIREEARAFCSWFEEALAEPSDASADPLARAMERAEAQVPRWTVWNQRWFQAAKQVAKTERYTVFEYTLLESVRLKDPCPTMKRWSEEH